MDRDEFDEKTIVNYFSKTYEHGKYSPGSFWCMFSFICIYILVKSKVDIRADGLIITLFKDLTVKHLKKKAIFFCADEMGLTLQYVR